MASYNFKCRYCDTGFVHEKRFMRHKCEMMKRFEHLETIEGMAAWNFYRTWMNAKKRPVNGDPETFLNSRFYKAFVRFTAFATKVNIPNTDIYIRLMCNRDFPPQMWTTDDAYNIFLEHMDCVVSSTENAVITVATLFDLAEKYQVEVNQIFEHITPAELIQLFRQRKLSPWLILKSPKFKDFYIRRVSNSEQIIINQLIRSDYWAKRFEKEPKAVQRMKKIVKELDL